MSEQLVSRYKDNALASKKGHIFSRLIDYFLCFILSFILYCFAYPITMSMSVGKNATANVNAVSKEIIAFVSKTKLQSYDEESGELIPISDSANEYVKTLVKTSAYLYDVAYPIKNEDGTYDNEHKVSVEETFIYQADEHHLDNISYYFLTYKANDESINSYIYDGVDYSSDKTTYIYRKLMSYSDNDITNFIEEDDARFTPYKDSLTRYHFLKESDVPAFISAVVYGDTSNSHIVSLKARIVDAYQKAVQYGIEEIENKCADFSLLVNKFNTVYQQIVGIICADCFISILIAYVLLFFLGALVNKSFRATIGQKIMKCALCDVNELEPNAWEMIIYHISTLLLCSTSAFISFFLSGVIGALSFELFPGFKLLFIMLALLIANIASFVIMLVSKNGHDLSTLMSRLVLKDKMNFDVPPQDDFKGELNGGTN
jgi:hypothetical protein